MQLTNHPPPYRRISLKFLSVWKKVHEYMAMANTVGYMRFILRLYQFGNSLMPFIGFKKSVKPEQKKNNTSPIVPPVASSWYFPYSSSMCELVISRTAMNFNMSTLIFLSFILVSEFYKFPFSFSLKYL